MAIGVIGVAWTGSVGAATGLIAFASDLDGDGEIYVMDGDGSNVIQLTHNSAWDHSPSWGRRLMGVLWCLLLP